MPRRVRSPFERRQRRAARIALYSSLALIVAAVAGVRPQLRAWRGADIQQAWANVDWAARRDVDLLRRYVQIDTSYSTGNEIPGARFLAEELRRAGLEPHLEILGDRHANVWAVLEGEDPRALVLHSHIDTDPLSTPEKWKFPPLSAHIDPPWLFGRGAFDMKSVAVAQLLAITRLAREGRPLRRSLIFLATGSEERGSDLGAKWVLARQPELRARSWAVLTEGGVVEAESAERARYWGIETAQKAFLDFRFCSPSRERMERLHWDLRDHGRPLSRIRVIPEVAEMFAAYGETRSREDYRELFHDFRELPFDLARFQRLPTYVRSMFRDEVEVSAVLPTSGGWRVRAVIGLLPDADEAAFERARRELLPDWMVHDLGSSLRGGPPAAPGSPTSHPAYAAAAAAVRARHPESVVGPYFLVRSATDARHFRLAGIPSYGFSPFLLFVSDTMQVGELNERISLPAFVEGVGLYGEVVDSLVR